MTVDVLSILGPDGGVARRLPDYELRPQQLEMAELVERAILERRHLVVEAGTGVGKSFAYLVPAILAASAERQDPGSRRPIVISTNTISLQEQLISRDIPFLNAVLPVEFSAVLVKGRGNYISLRRLKGAVDRQASLFGDPDDAAQLEQLPAWTAATTDGSRADLAFRPRAQVWEEVVSDRGNCLGRNCPTYDECFYFKARRRAQNADLLVVNHALFFSDLALRREGARFLPDYDVVILDEAHTVESVAAEHLGLSINSGQVEFLMNRLYNDRTQRGLLVHHNLKAAQQLVARVRITADEFFGRIDDWGQRHGPDNGRVREPPPVEDSLGPLLKRLAAGLATSAAALERDEEKIELVAAADRSTAIAAGLDTWLTHRLDDAVYWIESTRGRRPSTRLCSSPIDVGPLLRETLFDAVGTVVLTSATLAVGEDNFDFVTSRLGLSGATVRRLGSPFDFQRQCRLVLPRGLPDPGNARAYTAAVCHQIERQLGGTDGRAFVLFTSYRMMHDCAERLAGWLSHNDLTLFCQGKGLNRTLMLERFRTTERAVLFGTESFWQGVDVPGEALSTVVITRLPFSVPDHPLLEARLERIGERGGNPFIEYQVPEAIIKLKQGFGRLIRRQTDTGRVVILDPRLRTRPYGRLFLASLPECPIDEDEDED